MVHLPHSYIMLFAYLVMIMVQNDTKHFNHQELGRAERHHRTNADDNALKRTDVTVEGMEGARER